MKYVKEISLIMAGASVGFVFGGVSVIAAELKSKTIRAVLCKTISEKVYDTVRGETVNNMSYSNYYKQHRQYKPRFVDRR